VRQFFEPKPKKSTVQDRLDDAQWETRFAAIEAEADAILKAEGKFYVRGLYFASADDATIARMVEAERRVAQRDASLDRYISTPRARAAS